MKIIHTADIHLDSPLAGVKQSSARRNELIQALQRLAQYAENNGVKAVVVAGDLFDDKCATIQTIKSVASIIDASSATWFVLRGNHGDSTPYDKLQSYCSKVMMFGSDWTYYQYGNLCVCGRELGQNDQQQWNNLQLDGNNFNLVVLHGDVDSDQYGLIDKQAVSRQPINYLALGHRHSYAQHKMGKVTAVYSGVLESRGFDEAEQSGFVVIDTDTGKHQFVEQSIRRVVTVTVDITKAQSNVQLQNIINDAICGVSPNNYLNLVLQGTLSEDISLQFVVEQISGGYFAFRLQDDTTVAYDVEQLAAEISLRGEFVRLVQRTITDKNAQEEALKLGLRALKGEELL